MNAPQTFFVFFYALYSATAVTITGKLHPFDTPSMYKMYPRAWLRFLYSFFVLNLLPLIFFVYVYNRLDTITNFQITISSTLLLLLLSLAGLGFYRIFYGSMLTKNKNGYIFYDKELYSKSKGLPSSFIEDLKERPQSHFDPLPHLIPGIIWVLLPLLFAYFTLK
jgi:hypothetical protein